MGREKLRLFSHISGNKYIYKRDEYEVTKLHVVYSIGTEEKSFDFTPDSRRQLYSTTSITHFDHVVPNIISSENHYNSTILRSLLHYLNNLITCHVMGITDILPYYLDVFEGHPGRCPITSHDVEFISGTSFIRHNPYRLHPEKRDRMKQEVDYLFEHGLSPRSQGRRTIKVLHGTPQSQRSDRARSLSLAPGRRSDRRGGTIIVLLWGHYQIPLTEKAQQVSAVTSPFGLFLNLIMPFRMKNNLATFQRTMNSLLQDITGVAVYLDDILIFSEQLQQHLH